MANLPDLPAQALQAAYDAATDGLESWFVETGIRAAWPLLHAASLRWAAEQNNIGGCLYDCDCDQRLRHLADQATAP